MYVDMQCRDVIVEALCKRAPTMRQYFNDLFAHQTMYSVRELNALFAYEIIRYAPSGLNTMSVREWLYDYPTVNDWLRYIIPNVLPLVKSFHCTNRMSSYVIK